jgi:hypothetical protein
VSADSRPREARGEHSEEDGRLAPLNGIQNLKSGIQNHFKRLVSADARRQMELVENASIGVDVRLAVG